MAKKWRYVQKSIYICIFHILQCIWVLWMWSKYGDYVAFEQIVNNKCLSLAFDLNKVNKFAKPICPLALSELEFPKIIYLYPADILKLNYLPKTGFYALNFQSRHKKVFSFGRYHGGLCKELSIPHNFAGHFCPTFCI